MLAQRTRFLAVDRAPKMAAPAVLASAPSFRRSNMKRLLFLCLLPTPVCAQEMNLEDSIEIRSKDGRFRLKPTARLHVDAALFDEDSTPLKDGAEVRRARLGATLTLFRDFTLKYQYDFVDEGRVLDASFTYEGFDPLEIKIGQFKEPFSLEESTSSNNITFMERALPNEFASGYNAGIEVATSGTNWSAAGGVFGDRVIKDVFGAGDEDLSVTGRLTYAPLHGEQRVAHFGVGASRRDVDEGGGVRFATDPESAVADVNLVSTGSIRDVDEYYVGGLELAFVRGPVSIQGEFIHSVLDRHGGRGDLDFSGGYAYVSWFVTGEVRPYSIKRGNFGRIEPNRGSGAFELALRYSILDLNDGPVTGGTEQNATLGVNWYCGRNVRLMTNLMHAQTDSEGGNEDVKILQFRAQVYF